MIITNVRSVSVLACLAGTLAFAASETKSLPVTVAVKGGMATFFAHTNVAAISIKGKSNALEARVTLRRTAEGLQLEHLEAWLPVNQLGTGMGLRDEHMRKHIFTTTDGQLPDLRFEAGQAACAAANRESNCSVAGTLAIRGVARPFTVRLKVREEGDTFKATGDAEVKLSTYGIEQPSQLGVKTADDVQLHFDFAGRPVSGVISMLGGGR